MKSLTRLHLVFCAVICCSVITSVLADDEKPTVKAAPAAKLTRVVGLAAKAGNTNSASATHNQIAEIKVKGENGTTLQTWCLDAEGQILALVGPPRYGTAVKANAGGEVQVLTPDGQKQATW